MITVIADTSGLLAALDSAHPEHAAANEAIMAAGLPVMSSLLPAELDQHPALDEPGSGEHGADCDTDAVLAAILTLDRRDFRAVRTGTASPLTGPWPPSGHP